MKKIATLVCVLLIVTFGYSQNIFPSTGSVGIGITSPTELLSVHGGNIALSGFNYLTSGRMYLQYPIQVDDNYSRGMLGQNIYWNTATAKWYIPSYSTTNDFSMFKMENNGQIGFFTHPILVGDPNLTSTDMPDATLETYRRLTISGSGYVGIGTGSPAAKLHLSGNNASSLWGTNGIAFREDAATYNDNSSSGSVGGLIAINSFATPTITSSNTATYANAATLFIGGPPAASGSASITNPYALYVNGTSVINGFVKGAYSETISGSTVASDYKQITYTVDPTAQSGVSFRGGNSITWNNSTTPTSSWLNYVDLTSNVTVADNVSLYTGVVRNTGAGNASATYNSYGSWYFPAAGSGLAGNFYGFSNNTTTISNGTLTNYYGFINKGLTLTNSSVANFFGYYQQDVVGATGYTVGFYSTITSGTNKWNIYASGTAPSYFAGNLLIGKTIQANTNYMLDVNGTARVNQLVVNTTGADFVFEPGYKLTPLNKVEEFVKAKHYLPGVTPAAQMQKDGVDIGDNQTKLLQKIEELTLYIIEQDKKQQLQTEEQTKLAMQLAQQNKVIEEQGNILKQIQQQLAQKQASTK